jgi:hypothetical protein
VHLGRLGVRLRCSLICPWSSSLENLRKEAAVRAAKKVFHLELQENVRQLELLESVRHLELLKKVRHLELLKKGFHFVVLKTVVNRN